MIAAITLFLVVALSALITKVATIALTHTGLSTQSARFQARSAYTGAGFTTSESEKIMNHPVRRKIIFNLMLVGNAGIVTVMSSLILTFVLPDTLRTKLYGLVIVILGVTLVYWAIKSKWVDRGLSKVINRMLKKYTDLEIQDYAAVLHLKDDFRVSEKKVGEDNWLANKTLMGLDLRHEGITILGIDREGEEYIGNPTGSFEILPNDVITIYGKEDVIRNLYARKKDFVATMAHKRYVEKENRRIKEQELERNKPKTTDLSQ